MTATAIQSPTSPINTRRWPRYPANLPVLISFSSGTSRLVVPGLASEISRSGMALYGGAPLQPGDVMEVEFRIPNESRVAGIVRNRSGYCFGLEFLNPMSNGPAITNVLGSASVDGKTAMPLAYAAKNSSWRVLWPKEHRLDISLTIATIFLLAVLFVWWQPNQPKPSQGQEAAEAHLTFGERVLLYLGLAELPPVRPEMGKPTAPVWVDEHTALYYCATSELYGKTPGGHFTTQRDAQLDQFQPAAGTYCQ